MDYKEKVMAYAEVVNGMAPGTHDLVEKLQGKLLLKMDSKEELEFWHEVQGRVIRKGLMTELENLEELERSQISNLMHYPDISALVNSPNLLEWVHLLEPIEDQVIRVLNYQKDNMIMEFPKDRQKRMMSIDSLSFYNSAIAKEATLEQLFRYIPLMRWSLHNLIESGNYDDNFTPFLLSSFVPVLRAHRKAVLEMMELVDNEDMYMQREVEENANKIRQANIFTRDYKTEYVELSIPEEYDSSKPILEDPYVCALSYLIRTLKSDPDNVDRMCDDVKRAWHLTPFTCLHRLKLHADILGVYSDYMPAVRPKVAKRIDDVLYTHQKIYSQDNLVEGLTLAIYDVIAESTRNSYKHLYQFKFKEMYLGIKELLAGLINTGLITAQKAQDTLDELITAAKEVGIHDKSIGR